MRRFLLGSVLGLLAGLTLLLLPTPVHAVITRLTALADLISEATLIVTADVETLDAKRPAMILTLAETLKGKPDFKKMPVLLQGDRRAVKLKEPPELLDRLETKLQIVLFINKIDKEYIAIAFTNGTWFSMTGISVGGEIRWSLAHLEPYLRRTYAGTTPELTKIIRGSLAGKQKPPAPDAKAKPGLGPKVKKEKKTGLVAPYERPAYAVIPTVLVGGPLAMLALLFPAFFGGWTRWLALLSTAGTTSTLYTLQWWLGDSLVGTWWGSPTVLWTTMTICYLLGMCWAWLRHLQRVQLGEAPLLAGKVELILLGVVSLLGGLMIADLHYMGQSLWSDLWLPAITFVVAIWIGTLYVLWTWIRGRRIIPALGTETVVLAALSIIGVLVVPMKMTGVRAGGLEGGEGIAETTGKPELLWSFRLPDKGAIASTPVVMGERIYIAAAHDSVFRPYGALYCLEKSTGNLIWTFHDEKKMKQVFSTPSVVGEQVYIGEGFHQDFECKVFCLDAKTGKKLAEYQTGSHTESTPVVTGDRVYCGAGDDGLYCLEKNTLKKIWNFPSFHIDATPAVVGDRVYAGCGIGDVFNTTAILCVDATNGKQRWRYPTDHPVWSRPVVSGKFLFAGVGNGRLNESAVQPAGGIVCLRADTGDLVWKKKMPDGVLGRMSVDRRHLYVGCRDGFFYCLKRSNGEQVWRRDMGSPIVSGPASDTCECCGTTPSRMYVASIGGFLSCLEPATGKQLWLLDLYERTKAPLEVISTPTLDTVETDSGKDLRRIYLGTTILSSARVGELLCYEER